VDIHQRTQRPHRIDLGTWVKTADDILNSLADYLTKIRPPQPDNHNHAGNWTRYFRRATLVSCGRSRWRG
jgi:hypothetical protein